MKVPRLVLWVALAVAGCGSKTNPNVCCTDEANCAAQGLPNDAMCSGGLVCRGNTCVAETCSTSAQCEAEAPYCSGAGLCAATCEGDTECPGFSDDPAKMFCSNGMCVACRSAADCSATSPVCDQGTCRGCHIDSECESGACGTNGVCVDEESIVYASSTGTDVGTCSKAAPCASLAFAVQNTLANRSHIVLLPGTYPETTALVSTMRTAAPAITIHGGGATLKSITNGDSAMIEVEDVAMTLEGVKIEASTGSFGFTVTTGTAPVVLRNLAVDGHGSLDGLFIGANATLENVELANVHSGIVLRDQSHLLADRVAIHGGLDGIGGGMGIVSISNLVLYDLTRSSINLPSVSGSIEYSTVADTIAAGTVPSVVQCAAGLTIRSSIIWVEGYTPVNGPCALTSSIIGPFPTQGTTNTNVSQSDPLFADEAHRDFHLKATSPAIDQATTGPTVDYDGMTRPQGASFDLGAYEYKP